jgi:flagellar basal-body rod protein FlgB
MNEVTLLLNRVLDATALRSQALAGNIANVNTPGYQRRDVNFMSELKTALQSRSQASLKQFAPTIEKDKSASSVNLEREFSAISENQLLYTTSADILARKYAGVRRAIKGQ